MEKIKLIIYNGDLDIILEKVRRPDIKDVEREIINGNYAKRIADEIFQLASEKRFLIYDISKCGKNQEELAYSLRKTRSEIILFSSLMLFSSKFRKDLRRTLQYVPTYRLTNDSNHFDSILKADKDCDKLPPLHESLL